MIASSSRTEADGFGQWISVDVWASLIREQTTAHRLYTSSDSWIERYGDDVLISCRTEAEGRQLLAPLAKFAAAVGWKPRRVFGRLLVQHARESDVPELWSGVRDVALSEIVLESGLRYGIDFAAGYSTGLFLDQRANRDRWRAQPATRLLNCFAYTCAFSVAAAKSGAETLSVDLARKSLTRGEANLALNGLAGPAHRFIADDVLAVLPRLARRGEKFDGIVLDPPTFSRNQKGKVFQVEESFGTLIDLAFDILAPGGRMLLSVNCTRMGVETLAQLAQASAHRAHRQVVLEPGDVPPDVPPGFGSSTLWLRDVV